MHLEFLLEEPSMEAALLELVPKIRSDTSFEFHVHRGKKDLLKNLANRLRGYARWLPDDFKIVVVVDRDQDDCRALKQRLVDMSTDTSMPALHRIAIEELEAWFFGDFDALRRAYPRIPSSVHGRAGFRDPDAIAGGTWETLERVLQNAGYYSTGLPKVEVAGRVAELMDPDANRSKSFMVFRDGLRGLS
jgi:hypothetical protein